MTESPDVMSAGAFSVWECAALASWRGVQAQSSRGELVASPMPRRVDWGWRCRRATRAMRAIRSASTFAGGCAHSGAPAGYAARSAERGASTTRYLQAIRSASRSTTLCLCQPVAIQLRARTSTLLIAAATSGAAPAPWVWCSNSRERTKAACQTSRTRRS